MLTLKTRCTHRFIIFILLSMFTATLQAEAALNVDRPQPAVIASIKPLQLIIKEITGKEVNVEVLLPPNANPHFYHMRPSDIKKLTEADLLFWVGANMESFLPKVIDSLALENLALDPETSAHLAGQSQQPSPQNREHHRHEHDDNPHLWLDPVFVAERSDDLLARLVRLYPQFETTFTTNQRQFKARLKQLTEDYQGRFTKIKKRDIYSEHDAFSPLSQHFDLSVQDFIAQTPEKRPGAAHLSAISQAITHSEKICFLSESNALSRYLNVIRGKADVKQANIDILASAPHFIDVTYSTYISGLFDHIYQCVIID